MTSQDVAKRILSLKQRITVALAEKARLEGELESRKKSLASLVKEIKDKGYDPKKLKTIKAEKQQALDERCAEIETQLTEIEGQIKDMKGD